MDPTQEGSYRDHRCGVCGGPLELEDAGGDGLRFACPVCATEVDASAVRCPGCGWGVGALEAGGLRRLVCPACRVDLVERAVAGVRVPECPVCRGVMLETDVLEGWLADRASQAPGEIAGEAVFERERVVRYRRCPRCATTMNRTNYGPGSGVIVDVCRRHGLWLDSGELGQILEFARRGGVDEARRRREAEREREREQMRARPLATVLAEMRVTPGVSRPRPVLAQLLEDIFSWLAS